MTTSVTATRMDVLNGPALKEHASVYIPELQRIYIFGGYYGIACACDLWEWDLVHDKFTKIETFGTPPNARFNHTMCYHQSSNSIILHGGARVMNDNAVTTTTNINGNSNNSGINSTFDIEYLEDIWSLNLDTLTWSEIETQTVLDKKDHRCEHACVIDGDSMYIIGGQTAKGTTERCWIFDLKQKKWRKMTSMPLKLTGASAVFVNGTSSIFVFGGLGVNNLYHNTGLFYNVKAATVRFLFLTMRCF